MGAWRLIWFLFAVCANFVAVPYLEVTMLFILARANFAAVPHLVVTLLFILARANVVAVLFSW